MKKRLKIQMKWLSLQELKKNWFMKFEKTKEITFKEMVDVLGTKELKK